MKIVLVFAVFLAVMANMTAQDLRADKTLIISVKATLVFSDVTKNYDHTEDAIAKFGKNSVRWYFFANQIGNKVDIAQPPSKPGDAQPSLPYRTEYLASIGAGISIGYDSLRVYFGLGHSLDINERVNFGLSFKHNHWSFSGLVDMASSDWRYDVKILIFDPQPNKYYSWPFPFGIGVYAKSQLGFGLIGQMEPIKQLIINIGAGHNPEAERKIKTTMWGGVSFAF